MNIKRNKIKNLEKYGIKNMAWGVFEKEYNQANLQISPLLFQRILSEYKQLLDEELGIGTFSRFVANQRLIEEYQSMLPKFEFYNSCGFLFPRVIKEGRTRQDELCLKNFKERLTKEGVFELREQVLVSKARQTIQEKYSLLIYFLSPKNVVASYELYDFRMEHRGSKQDKALKTFLYMIGAMLQGEEEKIEWLERYYPDLYRAFLVLFRCVL